MKPRRSIVLPSICLLFLLGLSIFPYTQSGFYFDDIYNSELSGTLLSLHESLFEFLDKILNMWVIQDGRLYPLALITNYSFWKVSDDLLVDRTLQIIMVFLDIAAFWILSRSLSKSLSVAMMAVFLFPALLQVSNLFDGVTSFGGLYQIIPLFIFISLYALLRYVSEERASPLWCVLAVTAELCALLTYEVAVCLLPGMIAISFYTAKNSARRLTGLVASFSVFFLYLILYFWFLFHRTSSYDGSEFWVSGKTFGTFLAQFVSAFPLALLLNGPSPTVKSENVFIIAVLFVAFFLCSVAFLKNTYVAGSYESDRKGIRSLSIIAVSLMLFPPLIISVSKKYEHLVDFGSAYSVVYIQIFGVALGLSILLGEVVRLLRTKEGWFREVLVRRSLWVVLGGALAYSVVTTMTVRLNYERIRSFNQGWNVTVRKQTEKILALGFLSDVPIKDGVVILEDPYIWEAGFLPRFRKRNIEVCEAFLSLYAKKHVRCVTKNALAKKESSLLHVLPKNIYTLKRLVRGGNIVQATLVSEGSRTVATLSYLNGKETYMILHDKSDSHRPEGRIGVRQKHGGNAGIKRCCRESSAWVK